MTGSLNMNNKKIVSLAAPSNNNDAATKKYVDDAGSVFLKLDGSKKMTGSLDMNNKTIKNVPNPTASDQAVNLQFLGTKVLFLDGRSAMHEDLKMSGKRGVGLNATPINSTDATTKHYVDSNFYKRDGTVSLTGDLNIAGHRIKNLRTPSENREVATKKYVDDNKVDGSVILKLDGTRKMTGNLDMNNKQINNLPAPQGPKQPTPLAFTDLKYLHVAGTNKMTNNLNMDNKKIVNLKPPTSDTDAATKKYVDDNGGSSPDLSDFLKKDGTVAMTGELNLGGNKVIRVGNPLQKGDAVNKDYVDKLVHSTAVQPSHYKYQFAYLMSSSNQWTDEIDGGNSFNITKIGDLAPNKGNFQDYNHKVLYMTIYKNSQAGYKYKMGINFYRLVANADYTLCLELLNTDYQLWHKSQISVDKGSSTGLSIGNESIKKLSHSFTDSKGTTAIYVLP